MPSNRAILADLTEMGLDPTIPYTSTSSSGRLRPQVEKTHEPELKTVEVKNETKEETADKTEHTVSVEENKNDETVHQVVRPALVELPSTKKEKKKKGEV